MALNAEARLIYNRAVSTDLQMYWLVSVGSGVKPVVLIHKAMYVYASSASQ